MLAIPHLTLITARPSELLHLRRELYGLISGEATRLTVLHQPDGSCCRRESWERTLDRLSFALTPDHDPREPSRN